jgi:GTPase SAR1 family protein
MLTSGDVDTSLPERVNQIVEDFADRLTGSRRAGLDQIGRRLSEPVRVAVAGRVNSGKSTLVNALLRQAVAPTDVSECTRLVTWFHYGRPERVEVVPLEGAPVEVQLEADGTLPRSLPMPIEQVSVLHVYLDNDRLRRMTVIDTPGLGSINAEISAVTEAFLSTDRGAGTALRSLEAAASADAVAFVLNQTVKEDDRRMLREWNEAGEHSDHRFGLTSSAVNAIGVLTKADQLGNGRDPWPAAIELAARQSERIRDEVATVVPVIGLLAETANTAALNERDAGYLEVLAKVDGDAREDMLFSTEDFLQWESSVPIEDHVVPVEVRQRLLGRLAMFGLRYAMDQIDVGLSGAVALQEALARSSGIEALEQALGDNLLDRPSDVLRARSALDALEHLSRAGNESDAESAALRALRHRVELERDSPPMHEIAEVDALHAVLTGEVTFPSEFGEDLKRIMARTPLRERLGVPGGDRAEMRSASLAGVQRWKEFSFNQASPRQSRIADVVIRSYELALKQCQTV